MTGLDTNTDRIIEIAVIITDGHLRPVDEGVEWVIHTPKEVLDEYVFRPMRFSDPTLGWASGVPSSTASLV